MSATGTNNTTICMNPIQNPKNANTRQRNARTPVRIRWRRASENSRGKNWENGFIASESNATHHGWLVVVYEEMTRVTAMKGTNRI